MLEYLYAHENFLNDPEAVCSKDARAQHIQDLAFDSLKSRRDMQSLIEHDRSLCTSPPPLLTARAAELFGISEDSTVTEVRKALAEFLRKNPAPGKVYVAGYGQMDAEEIEKQKQYLKKLGVQPTDSSKPTGTAKLSGAAANQPEQNPLNPSTGLKITGNKHRPNFSRTSDEELAQLAETKRNLFADMDIDIPDDSWDKRLCSSGASAVASIISRQTTSNGGFGILKPP